MKRFSRLHVIACALAAASGCAWLPSFQARAAPEPALISTTSTSVDLDVPSAPQQVTARIIDGRVRVTWSPVTTADPPVSSYIVHSGARSCPVIVPASSTSVTVPIVAGQRRATWQVQAVNMYGVSSPGTAGSTLDVAGLADTRYRVVQMLQLSDFHGAIAGSGTQAGAARLVAALRADRRAIRPTFTVSAGDNIGGSPIISAAFDDLPAILALNRMGLDVTTLGNHEHDKPLRDLRRLIDASAFDWTVANYSTLAPLRGDERGVSRFVLRKRDGVTVGFVGMNTEDTAAMVRSDRLSFGEGRQIEISARVQPVQRQIDAARRAGADLVVVLLHQGWERSVDGIAEGRLIELAQQLRGAAVIYGAHTHQSYLSVIDGVSVVQPANSGRQYSRTLICLDARDDRVLGSWPQLIDASAIASVVPDPATSRIVDRYQRLLATQMDEVVGVVDTLIDRKPPPGGQLSDNALGNLITDAMRDAYGTDLAFVNIGGVRDTLPATGYESLAPGLRRPVAGSTGPYDVTLGDVMSALPFSDDLATAEVTGAQIWDALEAGQADYGANLFISGLRFQVDPKAPIGARILSVSRDDGTPISRDETSYSMALPAFLLTSTQFPGFTGPATIQGPLIDVLLTRLRQDMQQGRVTSARSPR